MVGLTCSLTKKYSPKQASISCFVNHDPQMFIASVLIVFFTPSGYDCDVLYLKTTILAFLGTPRLDRNDQFGVFCYYSQNSGIWVPLILQKRFQSVLRRYLGSCQLAKYDSIIFWKDSTIHFPKNGGTYVFLDKSSIQLQRGLYVKFRKPWSSNVKCFCFNGCFQTLES